MNAERVFERETWRDCSGAARLRETANREGLSNTPLYDGSAPIVADFDARE